MSNFTCKPHRWLVNFLLLGNKHVNGFKNGRSNNLPYQFGIIEVENAVHFRVGNTFFHNYLHCSLLNTYLVSLWPYYLSPVTTDISNLIVKWLLCIDVTLPGKIVSDWTTFVRTIGLVYYHVAIWVGWSTNWSMLSLKIRSQNWLEVIVEADKGDQLISGKLKSSMMVTAWRWTVGYNLTI